MGEMTVIQPKVRGFICTAAHPVGCYQAVMQQVEYVKSQGSFSGPRNALIIGASTGYGLATRIVATFGAGAKTIGVFFEKPAAGKRTASAGWYNTAAFEQIAHDHGHYAKSINGDAFSNEIKQQTIELIQQDLKQVDLIVYSLASPRRIHPNSGEVFSSILKPIGKPFSNLTINPITGELKEITLEPANEEEIAQTVAVMGGEDWEMWMNALDQAGVLAKDVITLAYSYIGPDITHAIYKNGTIGKAKDHLQQTANKLNKKLAAHKGKAFISVNKAVVTQASAAIPVVPLYISILFKIMKEAGIHEGCIEQMERLLKDKLYKHGKIEVDAEGRIRLDDWEMGNDIQQKVKTIWQAITQDNVEKNTDLKGYRDDFYRLFGFEINGVDYAEAVDPVLEIPSVQTEEAV